MPESRVDRQQSGIPDAVQTELVRRGLENIRRRLLDLTNRNKLISFRHGTSSLRIVDADLDAVYQSLVDDKTFPFVYVPEPTKEYLTETGEKPSAKDYAEQLGWSTGFDLAKAAGQTACLPVLHYQEDFETIIRKIGTTARTAIEESGANLLHLVFGFLEWRESDDSTQIRQAPLLVVPVSLITPKAKEEDRSVRVLYTGEDLTTNLSLVEKMRRDFGIEIPYIEEDETPERYFQRFAPILEQKRDWRICRQVSLALLSFGKLLMYLDLDAERWPADVSLVEHPRLLDMFSGSTAEGLTFATEFDIDEEAATLGGVPPLICDADSSQHSALIDAARGKNLVIEGPPGTGKSQTITNLIAASIASGKRVLFVAEKMAALEVVKRRLDNSGLGDFCLELHSHKTSKVGLLKSLEGRIQASPGFSSPTMLAQKQGLLNYKRDELTKYVSLLNAPYGAIGRTPFELIWQRDALREAVAPSVHEITSITFPDAHTWDYRALHERKDMVSTYEAHLRRMSEAGGSVEKKENPWGWLPDVELSLSDQDRLLSALPTLGTLCEQRLALIDALARTFSRAAVDVTDWLAAVDQWFSVKAAPVELHVDVGDWLANADQWTNDIPDGESDCHYDLLSVLSEPKPCSTIEHFLVVLGDFNKRLLVIPGGDSLLDSTIPSQFLKDDENVRNLGLADYSIDILQALAKAFSDCERHIARAKSASTELSQGLGVRASFTLRCLTDLIAARQLLTKAPLHLAHLRSPDFAKDGLAYLLQAGQKECATLLAEKQSLSDHFVVESQTPAAELNETAAILENTPWYSRLGKAYRRSALVYRSHCHTPDKRTRSQRAACLRLLAHSRIKIDAFSNRTDYQTQLGEHFSGVATAWDDLIVVTQWHEEVFVRLPEHQPFASEVRSALLTLPATRLRGILGVASGSLPIPEELEDALNLLTDLHARVPNLKFEHVDAELEIFLENVRSIVSASAVLLDTLKPIHLPETTSRAQLLELFDSVAKARNLRDLVEKDEAAKIILEAHYKGVATAPAPIVHALSVVRRIGASNFPLEVRNWLLSIEYPERVRWVREWIKDFGENSKSLAVAEKNVVTALGSQIPFAKRTSVTALQRAVAATKKCRESQSLLPMWIDAQRSAKQLRTAGLEYLVTQCLNGSISFDTLSATFEYLFCDTLLRRLFSEHPDLWRLSGVTHEEVRSQFASLDRSVINLNQLGIAYRASRRAVPSGVRGSVVKDTTELALVSHEISKQRAHIPIRQLMLRAGRAIQGLKPCFMMSPMSVAQFLAPGHLSFDLIVMDEASQLRPEDALGAVARGAQLVIVGDPKQLPPTSYFQRTLDDEAEETDEKSAVSEGESILDIALSRYQPVRRLRWHYRSQHHSLIAFSNSEFYDDNLVVFPSAYHEHPELGVKYVEAKGIYENRRNALEAERVVDAILEHIVLYPADSLGVVTMNFEQRELIEELLDMKLKQDSFSNSWIDSREGTPEPFFIKNLENVQGDERDVIFISVTYGPDVQGNYFQRFSGVNSATGQRRLNVLITRAKKRTVLFSSLDPDMIRSEPTTPWGVRALKGYMHFAKSGVSARPQISPGAEPSNEHEAAVGSVLKAQGYEVVPQVGVSGYYIDLAVRHPQKPGAFLLGIEFDGKSYHSGRSARDRDRLRQMTLENQGWKIHRIWSTDWFKNRNAEIDRLLHRVRALETQH
jgi:very-short-patch-repair endonuclease